MKFTGSPVIFGEVLMDLFPDGSRILGGCALNVAWNLQGLGLSPLLVSCVGEDSLASEALSGLKAWGLKTDFIQKNTKHKTGYVNVLLDAHGNARYESLTPSACDFISTVGLPAAAGGVLYFGTYSIRAKSNLIPLEVLKQKAKDIYVDMNLRDSHYTDDSIRDALTGADWVKVNEEEFKICFGKKATIPHALEVVQQQQIPHLLVTTAENGAFYVDNNGQTAKAKYPARKMQNVDTVGAGDAFSAAFIKSIYAGLNPEDALTASCEFARLVCGIRGATSVDKNFYAQAVDLWNEA